MPGIRGLSSAYVLRFCKYLPYIPGDFQAYASSCISLSVIVRFGLGADLEPKARHPAETSRPESRDYGTCGVRSEEHTSELQSHSDLVCRLLLEKKKKKQNRD